ncbi:MAG: hypothetical protein OXG70_05950 [Cyanobacteria bacterium MAG IRC1_bin_28]|nr:hypothetical protein [Cyanobacteria bacterium MAG IRC1_bin_28]
MPTLRKGRKPLSHGLAALAAGQDVVNLHHPEGEMGAAACTDALLLAVEAVAMSAVAGQTAKIGAPGRGIQGNGTGPERVVLS